MVSKANLFRMVSKASGPYVPYKFHSDLVMVVCDDIQLCGRKAWRF
jgi:hypothetical protein